MAIMCGATGGHRQPHGSAQTGDALPPAPHSSALRCCFCVRAWTRCPQALVPPGGWVRLKAQCVTPPWDGALTKAETSCDGVPDLSALPQGWGQDHGRVGVGGSPHGSRAWGPWGLSEGAPPAQAQPAFLFSLSQKLLTHQAVAAMCSQALQGQWGHTGPWLSSPKP